MLDDSVFILSSNRQLIAKKGDCYPLISLGSSQMLVEVKVDIFDSWTRADDTEIVPKTEADDAAAKYKAALQRFGLPRQYISPFDANAQLVNSIVSQMRIPLLGIIHDEATSALLNVPAAHSISAFPVDSASPTWQNSGLRVRQGDEVSLEADSRDTWDINGTKVDAGGYKVAPKYDGKPIFHMGTADQDWHWGSVACAIGASIDELGDQWHEREAGRKCQFKATKDGYLFFICNDSPALPNGHDGFGDNSGIIHVKAVVTDGTSQLPAVDVSGQQIPFPGDPKMAPIDVRLAFALQPQIRAILHNELAEDLKPKGNAPVEDLVPVDSNSPTWQNSGVFVKPGQHKWDLGWGPVDAGGYQFPPNQTTDVPVFHEGGATDWHWGALVCAVGPDRKNLDNAQQEIEVGQKKGFTVDGSGYLYFLTNDKRQSTDDRQGFQDNTGVIHVKVTVTDPVNAGNKTKGESQDASNPVY
jgi:hypothetical protein